MGTNFFLSSLAFNSTLMIILLMGALPNSSGALKESSGPSGNLSVSRPHPDWNQTINTNETEYVLPLTTIIGFLPKIYQVYKTIDSLLNPEVPKKTLEDVMTRVTQEFSEVKNQLKNIETKLTQQEVHVYHNVEVAVVAGLNDLKYQSSIDIKSRAVGLYDQLNIFLNGMLGHSTVIPDLLKTLRELFGCGSRSMYHTMDRFITLVNVGAVGISYYSKAINNKEIFDGDLRINSLSDKKDAVLKRLQDAMAICAQKDVGTINQYIFKVLSLMQADYTIDVTKALYDRFDDIYWPTKWSWMFYAAWEFDPYVPGVHKLPTHIQVQTVRYHSVCCNGYKVGEVKNGGWSVYWVGQPWAGNPGDHAASISLNTELIDKVVQYVGNMEVKYRHANQIHEYLRRQSIVSSGSREPLYYLIVTHPPEGATYLGGHPDQQLNAVGYRASQQWWFYHEVINKILFWRTMTVDIIAL